jgi:hypothetical protein
MTEDDVVRRCPHFVQRFSGWSDPAVRWMSGPVDGLPADEIASCRTAEMQAWVERNLWLREAFNTLGQMAKDLAAAWERDPAHRVLCPSDGPVPRDLPRRGETYQPTTDDWKGPGFSCMEFGMDQPMHFQYALQTGARGFVLTGHAQRAKGDHGEDVKLVVRGEIMPDGIMNIAPNIEETWSDVP